MEITEPRRLYQQLAADLKERIEQGVYLVGDKLPAERFIADEKNVSGKLLIQTAWFSDFHMRLPEWNAVKVIIPLYLWVCHC